MSKYSHLEIALLAAITALAAFFRFYRLDSVPPGFQFDQAFNAFDILRLLEGQFAIFFPANTGREPLYFYLSMPSVALFGASAFAIKFTSALIGLLTIPLIYGFTRSLFSPPLPLSSAPYRGADRIAALAALFSAISLWHIFFSRDGLRVILQVPLTLLTFWYLWRGLSVPLSRSTGEGLGVRAWLKIGLFLSLALYTYPSARLLPLALIFLTAYAAWNDRPRAMEYFKGMAIALVVAAILFAPLGIYFLLHPDQFIAHTESISVFDPRVNEGNIPAAMWKNVVAILGMFFIRGDGGSIHNLPFRPVFDPLTGALFVVGAAAMLIGLFTPSPTNAGEGRKASRASYEQLADEIERRDDLRKGGEGSATRAIRDRATFLATWILVSLASSLFSDDAPNFLRMLPALPAIVILPAWGASEIWQRLTGSFARRAGLGAFGVMLAFSATLTWRDYFVSFASLPDLYYTFDVDKVEVSTWIDQNARAQHIYLAPLWYQQGTVSLLTRNLPLKSFESRDTIVLPGSDVGKDALFAFPPEQERKVQTMAERLGALGTREELPGSNGGKLLLLYRVPARNLPDAQNPLNALTRGGAFIQPQEIEPANWEDQIGLLGYTVSPAGPGGRNLTVNLFLHALAPMADDYTFSLKVRDQKDRVWGQEDKWAGDNSYETSHWGAGDVVIERFYPGLNACAPAGDYQITVEAYNPKTSKVLALTDRPGNVIALGRTHAEASQSNRLEDLEPDHSIDVQVGERLHLLGYSLSADQVRLGDEFSLSLFWRGSSIGSMERITVRLKGAGQEDSVLFETDVTSPPEGRGLCSFFELRVPSDFAPGPATIWINGSKLAGLNLTK